MLGLILQTVNFAEEFNNFLLGLSFNGGHTYMTKSAFSENLYGRIFNAEFWHEQDL